MPSVRAIRRIETASGPSASSMAKAAAAMRSAVPGDSAPASAGAPAGGSGSGLVNFRRHDFLTVIVAHEAGHAARLVALEGERGHVAACREVGFALRDEAIRGSSGDLKNEAVAVPRHRQEEA